MLSVIHKKRSPSTLREDDVTSFVFGTLSLLPPRQQHEALCNFFSSLIDDDLSTGNALIHFSPPFSGLLEAEIELWPNIATEGRNEPDVQISVKQQGETIGTVLIEVKWDLTADDGQIAKQKEVLKKRHNSGHAIAHVLLERDKTHVLQHQSHHLTWMDIRQAALQAKGLGPLSPYIEAVEAFLDRCGILVITALEDRLTAKTRASVPWPPRPTRFWVGLPGWPDADAACLDFRDVTFFYSSDTAH